MISFYFVGRLVGDKGINELIAAFRKIRTSKSETLLVGSFETELDPLEQKQ
jgi:glycosyltransferase involved in cell wall biosynthesis